MKEDEKNKHNAVLSQDELERMRKLSLFKIGAMIVFAAVVIVFGSMHMQIKQMTAETA